LKKRVLFKIGCKDTTFFAYLQIKNDILWKKCVLSCTYHFFFVTLQPQN